MPCLLPLEIENSAKCLGIIVRLRPTKIKDRITRYRNELGRFVFLLKLGKGVSIQERNSHVLHDAATNSTGCLARHHLRYMGQCVEWQREKIRTEKCEKETHRVHSCPLLNSRENIFFADLQGKDIKDANQVRKIRREETVRVRDQIADQR